MDFDMILRVLLWTAVGGLLLFVLMFVDSLFTKYNDLEEVKAGNMAVTTRLILAGRTRVYFIRVDRNVLSPAGGHSGIGRIVYHIVCSRSVDRAHAAQFRQAEPG